MKIIKMNEIHLLAITDSFDNGFEEWIVFECREDNKDYFLKSLPSLEKANEWIDSNYLKLNDKYSRYPEDYNAYVRR